MALIFRIWKIWEHCASPFLRKNRHFFRQINIFALELISRNFFSVITFYSTFPHYVIIKHEYLRSRASICLSLSSPPSSSGDLSINSYTFVSFSHSTLSRYSCLHLGSLHPRIFCNQGELFIVKHNVYCVYSSF